MPITITLKSFQKRLRTISDKKLYLVIDLGLQEVDMRVLPVFIGLFLGFVLDAGCRPPEIAPVITLHQGEYEVEIRAPGGVLKQGPNNIQLQVREDSICVSFEKERLVFKMPHIGGESYTEETVNFLELSGSELREGEVTLDMPGRWKGQLYLEVPDEIIALTFNVDVMESI